MELSDLKKDIETFEDPKLRRVLLELYGKLLKKDNVIINLQNRLSELENRVLDNEKYTSKDCLIFENMPRTTDGRPLPQQVCEFLKVFLNYNTQPANFKACHVLGKGNGRYPPAVIVKFVYFEEKSEIYHRKSWLARKANPYNGSPIFIKERLPKVQKELKDHADELDLITTTNNCNVKVFTKNADGIFKSVEVKSKRSIDDIKEVALKKNKPMPQKTPKPDAQLLKKVAKRIRESPGDGVSELKQFCSDPYDDHSNEQGY